MFLSDLKTCFKCGADKPRTEFYAHSAMADGLLGKCKECAKADVAANYAERRDQYLAYEKRRRDLPHRVEGRKKYAESDACKRSIATAVKRYEDNNPDKKHAHNIFSNAVRDGRVVRQPCAACGNPIAQGHHEDYSLPLEVIWLCTSCHAIHHTHKRIVNDFWQRFEARNEIAS